MEHIQIQLDYLINHFDEGRREYQIPEAGANSGKGYADLVNLQYSLIWEIKSQGNEVAGQTEVERYVSKAIEKCPPSFNGNSAPQWSKGSGYAPHYFLSKYPDKYLMAFEEREGVIIYKYEPKNTVTYPNLVPAPLPLSITDQLKELINKLKDNTSKFKEIISEYLREHPQLINYIKGAAFTTAVAVIVGTIIEDFFTGGAGILGDIASFKLAYQIVRFAWAL